MNDHPDFTPTLTLNPTLDSSAPAAPAAPTPAPAPVPAAAEPNRQEMIAAVSAALAEELGTDVSAIRVLSMRQAA